MKTDLTNKQENFSTEYVKTSSASDAYRFAYSTGKMQKTTINRKAMEVLKVPKVEARIRHLKGVAARVAAKQFKIDSKELLRYLDNLRRSKMSDYAELVEVRAVPEQVIGFDDEEMEDIYATEVVLRWKPFSKLTELQIECIESMQNTKYGVSIKLHGKDWTTEKISKHIGFYEKDNTQKAPPIEYKNVSKQFDKP